MAVAFSLPQASSHHCLSTPPLSHTIPAFKWIPDSFCKWKKENKTDRQAQDGETWMECKCGKVCISSVYHKGSFSPVDCFKQVSRTDSKSLFILGSSLSGIRQKKELLYMTTITCNYLVTWDFTNHIQLLWYVSISQSVHKIISQFGKWHMLRSAPARSN